MHIKINRAVIAEALNGVQSVVGSKITIPILQNVKISAKEGKVDFVCSDIDITIQSMADCEVVKEGETTLPVKLLSTAIGKIVDGDIVIESDDKDRAKLTAGSSVFKFNGMPASDFPKPTEVNGAQTSIPCATLKEMLRKTAFAMSTDETRLALGGILVDFSEGNGKVIAVATDGRRLGVLNVQGETTSDFKEKFILPRKTIDILQKRLPKDGDCTITSIGSQVRFETGKMVVTTKVIDAAFPNYKGVIPEMSVEPIVVNRTELLGSIDRASVFAIGVNAPSMEMTFGDNKVVIQCANREFGSSRDDMPIKYDGEKHTLCFVPQYIKDVLSVLDEDEVEFYIEKGIIPIMVREHGKDDFMGIVMPMRQN